MGLLPKHNPVQVSVEKWVSLTLVIDTPFICFMNCLVFDTVVAFQVKIVK
jgi:hypothetical protein